MKLLLVEDDALLGDGIQAGLKQAGFVVDWVRDGDGAQLALDTGDYGVLLLDLGIPRIPGLELLKRLRGSGNAMPVLILTARDAVNDRVQGLDAGADDYLVKPFDLKELAARVRALSRRATGRTEGLIRHGELALDPASRTVSVSGKRIDLPQREFALLLELLENRGRVLSREQLEERLYGWGEEIESNALEVHVHHLRKKLGTELIRTVRGVGYMIEPKSGKRER